MLVQVDSKNQYHQVYHKENCYLRTTTANKRATAAPGCVQLILCEIYKFWQQLQIVYIWLRKDTSARDRYNGDFDAKVKKRKQRFD